METPISPKSISEESEMREKAIDLRSETDLSLDELMIEMSACGHLLAPMMGDPNSNITEVTHSLSFTHSQYINHIFKEHMITYEAFCKNPDLIFDPNVLFRIRDKYSPISQLLNDTLESIHGQLQVRWLFP